MCNEELSYNNEDSGTLQMKTDLLVVMHCVDQLADIVVGNSSNNSITESILKTDSTNELFRELSAVRREGAQSDEYFGEDDTSNVSISEF